MHRSPRSLHLDTVTRSLLLAMGVSTPFACGGQVTVQGGSGGSDGAGGSATTTTISSTSTAVSSGTGGASSLCVDPQPVIIAGRDVGLDTCAGGQYRRRAAVACPDTAYPPNPCCGTCPPGFVCNTGAWGCECVEACETDANCNPGELCFCSDTGGHCVSGSCQVDADCPGEQACFSWDPTEGCGAIDFVCSQPGDECGGDADCVVGNQCIVEQDGMRACISGGCAIGRPFLVSGEERTAPLVARRDWSADALDLTGLTEGLTPADRSRHADHWCSVGAMEHASIAAFARFAIQLLALGAPPDLLERCHQAMADETRHARAAFALASAYAGSPVGPGPLPVEDAMADADDVERFVTLLLVEGCIGETVASVEAAETQVDHPAVAAVLDRIATEEADHAELAWRTLAWALEAHPAATHRAMARLRPALDVQPDIGGPTIATHGPFSEAERAALRAHTIRAVVRPCIEALFSEESSPPLAQPVS